jgi:hypothetical protein
MFKCDSIIDCKTRILLLTEKHEFKEGKNPNLNRYITFGVIIHTTETLLDLNIHRPFPVAGLEHGGAGAEAEHHLH